MNVWCMYDTLVFICLNAQLVELQENQFAYMHMLTDGEGSAAMLAIHRALTHKLMSVWKSIHALVCYAQQVELPENHVCFYFPICTCSHLGWVQRPCS